MTRKRFIKLCMAKGLSRNEAAAEAKKIVARGFRGAIQVLRAWNPGGAEDE